MTKMLSHRMLLIATWWLRDFTFLAEALLKSSAPRKMLYVNTSYHFTYIIISEQGVVFGKLRHFKATLNDAEGEEKPISRIGFK